MPGIKAIPVPAEEEAPEAPAEHAEEKQEKEDAKEEPPAQIEHLNILKVNFGKVLVFSS